jgi:Pyruvate/2-oxoacid:ferredoxin oxidoreductase delta subunit
MVIRNMVKIDEDKCNGCGQCIIACAEGALQIIDGKAKLITDEYCDGLGACLGECPQDAITIEKRKAEAFNEEAVEKHLSQRQSTLSDDANRLQHSCPSTQVMQLEANHKEKEQMDTLKHAKTKLSQWPIQLKLVPPNAPFFENADLLITADCVPFAYPEYHAKFLKGKALIIGCSKLDNAELYKQKLTEILTQSTIKSITVVNMEVPCCFGLYHFVKEAMKASGKTIPLKQHIISIKGERLAHTTSNLYSKE